MHASPGRQYGVTGHVIGCPFASIVVYSVVTKRAKTCWTSGGGGGVRPWNLPGGAGAGSGGVVARPAGQQDPGGLARDQDAWLDRDDFAPARVVEQRVGGVE